ncbi:hypothetical protein [uncultured Polaribacter sp.]|uniref:hypothetical protein n=1 Tax=uncultured Polaribacter sp. TaxID=174711 RepID=UPI0026289D6F|nr:hypothetical protein [uncultured Polaribacter sp.]
MKKLDIFGVLLLLPSIGLIFFGLNAILDFLPFENKRTGSLLIMILSIVSLVLIIRKMNKDVGIK